MTLEDKSNEYSFNIQSKLFNILPNNLKELWVEEVKKHFINGYKEANVWNCPKDKLPEGNEQVIICTDTQSYYIADFDKEAEIFYDMINRPFYICDVVAWCYLPKFNKQ